MKKLHVYTKIADNLTHYQKDMLNNIVFNICQIEPYFLLDESKDTDYRYSLWVDYRLKKEQVKKITAFVQGAIAASNYQQ